MKTSFSHLSMAPRRVPSWPTLLADLREPSAEDLARTLDLSARTVRRYNATGDAPLTVRLALFWLTTWGRSAVHTQAVNDAQTAAQYAQALERQVREMEATIKHLLSIGHFGAANDPGQHPTPPRLSHAKRK